MNFCTTCGSQLKPGARFCGSCGENINSPQLNELAEQTRNAFSSEITSGYRASSQEFSMKNSQRRIVNLWLILMAVFLFCMFLPSIIGLDGFDGGFALSFAAGFMVIMSIIVIMIYRSRAKQLDNILAGEGRIAVWKYTPAEWVSFITIDFEEEKKTKKFLFYLVSAISVIVGIILLIVVQDPLILLISLGVIPLVAVPAFLAPRMRYKKLQNSESKALISEKGVIVGKMFHLWVKLGARLDQVVLVTDEQPPILEFHYSIPTRNGRQESVARVPVPSGKTEEAIKIGEYFSSKLSEN